MHEQHHATSASVIELVRGWIVSAAGNGGFRLGPSIEQSRRERYCPRYVDDDATGLRVDSVQWLPLSDDEHTALTPSGCIEEHNDDRA